MVQLLNLSELQWPCWCAFTLLLDIIKRQESRCCSFWLQENCSQMSVDRVVTFLVDGNGALTQVSEVVLLKGCSRSLNLAAAWSKLPWPSWWGWVWFVGCFPLVLSCPKGRNNDWTRRGNLNHCVMLCGSSEPDWEAERVAGGVYGWMLRTSWFLFVHGMASSLTALVPPSLLLRES